MRATPTNPAILNVGGNFILTNGSLLYVYSAMTNSGTDYYGALVNVGGDMTVAPLSWVYPVSHSTNGGSPVFRMQNLDVANGGGFNADTAGFAGGGVLQNGYGDLNGCGKCRNNGSDTLGNGAGYGGNGGGDPGYFGTTCGLSNAPTAPGSGGSGRGQTANIGGSGGGLVRIEAVDRVTLNGLLSANGQGSSYAGSGSGGGIYIRCKRFAGSNGLMNAMGGSAGAGGGGGGGRIAVSRERDLTSPPDTTWTNSVAGGSGGYTGSVGTIYFGSPAPSGSVFKLR